MRPPQCVVQIVEGVEKYQDNGHHCCACTIEYNKSPFDTNTHAGGWSKPLSHLDGDITQHRVAFSRASQRAARSAGREEPSADSLWNNYMQVAAAVFVPLARHFKRLHGRTSENYIDDLRCVCFFFVYTNI